MAKSMNKLLSAHEVSSFLEFDMSICTDAQIFKHVYNEFLLCLGVGFRLHLLNNLADYADHTRYDNDAAYAVDDVVTYKGKLYINIEASTSVLPTVRTNWAGAPKFTEPCLEELWCNFLGPYLAWVVFRSRLPFLWRRIGAHGLTKLNKSELTSVDYKDYATLLQALMRECEISFENLDHFIKLSSKQSDYGGCYDTYKGLSSGSCSSCNDVTCGGCEGDDCYEANQSGYGYEIG